MSEATDPEAFLRICEAACNGAQLFGFVDPLELEGRLLHSAVICCTVTLATIQWPCQCQVCQKAGNRDTNLRACPLGSSVRFAFSGALYLPSTQHRVNLHVRGKVVLHMHRRIARRNKYHFWTGWYCLTFLESMEFHFLWNE